MKTVKSGIHERGKGVCCGERLSNNICGNKADYLKQKREEDEEKNRIQKHRG